MIIEDQLEQLCLDWFRYIGYGYIGGYNITHDGEFPEGTDYQQIVLFERLLTQLQKINPHIPVTILENVSQHIAKPETPMGPQKRVVTIDNY